MRPTSIVDIEVVPLDLRLTESFAIAGGAQHAAANALVKVTLAGGAVGLGEAAPFPAVSGETQASSIAAALSTRAWLVGQDASAWRRIAGDLAAAIDAEPAARCAVEAAVLDALGRHHGVSLGTLFGGLREVLETDLTVTAGDADHAARSARAAAARGIHTLKVKVGALSPEEDAARLAAVHDAAPGARLLVDANGGYDVKEALAFLAAVAAQGVSLDLFEQPVHRDDEDGFARVAGEGRVLVCADESVRSAADVLRLAARGVRCAVNIKTMKCGIAEALSIWSVARAAGMPLMIGGMVESVLSMTVSAHLASGLGGFAFVDLDTPMFIVDSPFEGGFRQEGAQIRVDHVEAGHGVRVAASPGA